MPEFIAHIINHTHWDREWFLTSIYTSRWIAGLIDKIEGLAAWNPAFHFFLDGQTLVIEDLLQLHPDYREKVERLVRNGNLLIGPYYCQPDWRMTSGEALLRNLLLGWQDMQQHAAHSDVGWLVDTFGHISQAPQLHRLFNIQSVYIWRGAPRMEPYFYWQPPDGAPIFTINLFGGYRNLYGVTHTPDIAVDRIIAEMEKLAPFYPTGDIPLFDGYDLEDNPEDPLYFYQQQQDQIPPEIEIREATPASFAQEIQEKNLELPVLSGELNSGKYGAVFPGTLSTRLYLKRMAYDCERLLYQLCEPLAVLARWKGRPYPAEFYQGWSRVLLQNAVHDCLCGVSVDQVHEKMELSYHQAFDTLLQDLQPSLDAILADFASEIYTVSTNPFPFAGWIAIGDTLYRIETSGVGVWETSETLPVGFPARPIASFSWQNEYYSAQVRPDGTVQLGQAVAGSLLVFEERGDTYSNESGPLLGALGPAGPLLVEQESQHHCVLRFDCSAAWENCRVEATVRLTFDSSPLVRWQVSLDGRGTDYRVEIAFETGLHGQVQAGMPFDVVDRPFSHRDLLPRNLEPRLESVLLGQRELDETRTFAFQDFVTLSDGSKSATLFAQGLHAYQAWEDGRVTITLNRAVEWLTRPALEHRVGDAGPFFYVPDARGERQVVHDLAICAGEMTGAAQIIALNAAFQNPPLLVRAETSGTRTEWRFFQESLPVSSLHFAGGQGWVRLYNPTPSAHPLTQSYPQADVFGNPLAETTSVPSGAILTLSLGEPEGPVQEDSTSDCHLLNPPAWQVGLNHGLPDPAIIQQIDQKIAKLAQQLAEGEANLVRATGSQRYLLQHRDYVLQRELLEYRLSKRLNEIKLGMHGQLTPEYLYQPDEEIAAIGSQLNQLRIQRRIYDYVIQILRSKRE